MSLSFFFFLKKFFSTVDYLIVCNRTECWRINFVRRSVPYNGWTFGRLCWFCPAPRRPSVYTGDCYSTVIVRRLFKLLSSTRDALYASVEWNDRFTCARAVWPNCQLTGLDFQRSAFAHSILSLRVTILDWFVRTFNGKRLHFSDWDRRSSTVLQRVAFPLKNKINYSVLDET